MFRIYKTLIAQSLEENMTYRTTTVLTIIFGIAFYAISIVAGGVYFSFAKTIYGWQFIDYLNLITTANLISYIYQLFFVVSHEELTETILQGNLDYSLLRPINSYWFHAFYRLDFPSTITVLLTVLVESMILWSRQPTIQQLILYILSVLLGVLFVFDINQIFVTATFWFDGLTSLTGIPEDIMNASARPSKIYPSLVRMIFLWFVPSLAVTNLPVEIIQRNYSWGSFLWVVAIDLLLLRLSYIEWQHGLRHYVSAD